MDEVINQILDPATEEETLPHQNHRERLITLISGGQAKYYLGVSNLTVDQVNVMNDEEIEKLYACYEAKLGSMMTKTLGQTALQLYYMQ